MQNVDTVFENHRKSLIYPYEQNELRFRLFIYALQNRFLFLLTTKNVNVEYDFFWRLSNTVFFLKFDGTLYEVFDFLGPNPGHRVF